MRRVHILFLAVTAILGVLLVLFSIFTAPSDTTLAASSSGYTFDELLEGNLLPFAQSEISCTVSVTTTDSLNNSNTSSDKAVSLSDYDNLALVADTDVPEDADPETRAVHDDWFRFDNADIGSTYEVEALPDYTTNYNLGIIVYDLGLTPIITDSNAVDNNQAKVTLVPETQGPYYFKVFQISQQCSGRTYDLETSFTGPPTPTPTPGTSAFRLYLPVLIKHNLEQAARLFIEKDVSHSFAQPCDTISYTIVYGNIGAATVSGTVIVDRIPRHTGLVKGSITDGGEENEGTITWNVGKLAPREGGSVSYSVTIDEDFSGYVVNVADVDSEQTDSLTSDPALTQVTLTTMLTSAPWLTETPTP